MFSLTILSVLSVIAGSVNAYPMPLNETFRELDKRVDHWGQAYYYFQTGVGACGYYDSNSDSVVAISLARYNANNGGNCNRWIEIINTNNGKKAYGRTRDSCPSCGTDDLSLSTSLFQKLGNLNQGTLPIQWHFMNPSWSP